MKTVPDGRFPRAWHQSPRRFASAGPSAHAIPAGKIRTKRVFGANLCDEASEAMQEQMFYAVFHSNPSTSKNKSLLKCRAKIMIVKVFLS